MIRDLQLHQSVAIPANDDILYDEGMVVYVGVSGSLHVLTYGGDDVTFENVRAGEYLPVIVRKVFNTGTTASLLVGSQFTNDMVEYLSALPSWSYSKYSLAFDAEGAERLNDYEANTLYFRDANFNRVAATFTRTTEATRIKADGQRETVAANVPRIDHSDGSAKLLLEPARTNIFLFSEAPATQVITVVNGTVYTVWIEGSGSITLSGAGTGVVTEGTPVTFTASGTSLTCTVAGTVTAAQVEAGTYATSLIITAGSAVTRTAESCRLTPAGDYLGAEAVLYGEQSWLEIGAPSATIGIDDATSNNRMRYDTWLGRFRFITAVGGSAVNISVLFPTANTYYKIAAKHSNLNTGFFVDGVKEITGTSLPAWGDTTLSRVALEEFNGSSSFRGRLKSLIVFPTALTDDECIQLTS